MKRRHGLLTLLALVLGSCLGHVCSDISEGFDTLREITKERSACKILLVENDDQIYFRQQVRKLLSEWGFEVVW